MPRKYVYACIAILTLTALYVCATGLPLIWDGAFQLSVTLIRERPFVYLTRFHTLILWWPVIWASRFTSNPWILQAIYGFPFIIAPALSVLVSWWIVRRHAPWVIIWVIFGVAAGTLCGQVFIINDSIWQQTLFWPLFLCVFVPLTRPQFVVLGVLAIFQFVHQIGVPLLFGAALAGVIISIFDVPNRRMLLRRSAVMVTLFVWAVAKIYVTNHISWLEDTYAEQEFGWSLAVQRFQMGVEGWPLAGLTWIWFAALFALIQPYLKNRLLRTFLGWAACGFALVAGAMWIHWASDGHLWYKALDYRRWILPLSFPFFTLAIVEACVRARRIQSTGAKETNMDGPGRGRLACIVACIFAAVLATQGTVWSRMFHRLLVQVNSSPAPAVALESFEWVRDTPLDHWGTCDAVTLLEGKTPHKLLVMQKGMPRLRANPPVVPNQGWFWRPHLHPPPPGPGGWFDFAPILKEIAKQPPTTRPAAPVNRDASTHLP